ncbi:MAG: RNA polymerase sigma factor [Ktedonobacteraceae bacterium]
MFIPIGDTGSIGAIILPTDDARIVEVVENARAGDEAAFNALFQHYNARICNYLARMVGNDEEGRDLAQETFIKAWRALPGVKDNTRFDTWLYRIATNIAIDYMRFWKFRRTRGTTDEENETMAVMSTAGPEQQVAEVEQVRLALKQVKSKYRACLLLQIDAGFTQREIAELLHISEKSVSVYVSRGCEQFRIAYEQLEHGPVMNTRRRPQQ